MPNIIKPALMHFKDGKLLMARSRGKDAFYNPGGGIEPGETDIQGLAREVKEELGVNIIPESVRLYGIFTAQAHGRPVGTMVEMRCYYADFSGEPAASNEIEEIAYLGMSDLDRISPVGLLIFADAHKKGLLK
jgi:8-oxo-dGTP pyrophosphatase MutT (NUDIX family)